MAELYRMMEMLWTDPQKELGRSPSKRGIGMMFGPDVTERFCDRNGLKAIIRSHEVRMEGYEVEHNGRCITGKLYLILTIVSGNSEDANRIHSILCSKLCRHV